MGSIWGDCVAKAEESGRICEVEIDPEFPVSTAWDLGRTDDTAIWFFQMIENRIHVVDYYANNGKEIEEYAQVLRDWASKYGVKYGTHWLPHDAKPRRLGMGGKSILQQFHEEDVGRFALVPNLDKQEGIYAARKTFPICRFDKLRCEEGLECLRQYHRQWNEEDQKFSDSPDHDWSSHGADAWRYLSLVWKHPKSKEPGVPVGQKLMAGSIQNTTFGALRDKHLRTKRAERKAVFH
jgi:hypothetical protein